MAGSGRPVLVGEAGVGRPIWVAKIIAGAAGRR
jgi:hypothetical protein